MESSGKEEGDCELDGGGYRGARPETNEADEMNAMVGEHLQLELVRLIDFQLFALYEGND